MKLYIANGIYVGTQAEAKRIDKGFREEEVPTSKQELIDYLNKVTLDPQANPEEPPTTAGDWQEEPPTAKPAEPQMPSFRRNLELINDTDVLCASVAELEGVPLGYVALEVAARYTALAKRYEAEDLLS